MRIQSKKAIISFLIICLIAPILVQTGQAAPPSSPKTYETTLESKSSVYVSEYDPTNNFDSGMDKYSLAVGGDEFNNKAFVTYVKFDLSVLPDDADILDAEIHLHLPDVGDSLTINMYPILQNWGESTVTWDSSPMYKDLSPNQGLISSLTVSTEGWHDWEATSVVGDWVDGSKTNYGVAFESTSAYSLRFSSDDTWHEPQLWVLYKSSSGEEPEDPPEDPPEDTTPCEIEYTVTPENPRSGDTVTITANATDDVAMEYVSILKGGVEVEYCEAVGTQTTLTCQYAQTFSSPGNHSFTIIADDKGAESAEGVTIYVDIMGTGSNPVVTIDIEYDGEDIIPDHYQLLPMDGQRIDITATATDPDGIDMMTMYYDGNSYDFMYDPPQTDVEETITLFNGVDVLDDCSAPCTFRYSVRAYDAEDRETRVEGDDIEIKAPWQWHWGLPFANWGCEDSHWWSWSMMESIFGSEVWWNKEHEWKKPHAKYLYNNKIKEGGRGGQCYGMCALALELAQPGSGIYANLLQSTAAGIDDLEREHWNTTWRYYYARQSSQYSQDICLLTTGQYLLQPEWSGSGMHPFIEDILDDIIDDLNNGKPGMLSIHEGGSGHAVVPWRVEPVDSSTYHVYIYDPNHNYASTHDSTDYTNFEYYPYIVFGEDGWARNGWWSYQWNSTSTWNENIYYLPYDSVIGNPSSTNYIGSHPTTITITDQRLPDPIQTLFHGSGDATFYAEDSSGRKTGIVDGDLIVEIPYSAPVFDQEGTNKTVDLFMLPSNITVTFHCESSVKSEKTMGNYSMMIWSDSSSYALKNVSVTKNTKDQLIFTPRDSNKDTTDHSIRFRRGDVTEIRFLDPMEYTITLSKEFHNSPTLVGRQYSLISGQHDKESEIELYVSDDYDDLVVETYNTPFSFTIETQSTESLEENPTVDYIPKSTGTFSMEANDKMTITPDNWATDSPFGPFTSDNDQIADTNIKTPGFEFALMLIILFGFLILKRR